MLKTLGRLALCLTLLGGSAKAFEYKDNFNDILKINGTADYYMKAQTNVGRADGKYHRLIGNGKVRLDVGLTKAFNSNVSISAITRLDLLSVGDKDQVLQRAYLEFDHVKYGTLKAGRYEGFAGVIGDMSDVDVLIGTPAHTNVGAYGFLTTDNLTGGGSETGIQYSASFADNTILVVAHLDTSSNTAQPSVPSQDFLVKEDSKVTAATVEPRLTAYRDYRFGVGAQFKKNYFTIGANYNYTLLTVATINPPDPVLDMDQQHAGINYGILGVAYDYKTLHVGVTGNVKYFSTNKNVDYSYIRQLADGKASEQILRGSAEYTAGGVEVGAKFGCMNVYNADGSIAWSRLVTSGQYDYSLLNRYVKFDKDSNIDSLTDDIVTANIAELAVSYYVTPKLHYVVSAAADLRSTGTIAEADGVEHDKVHRHNYYGVGVAYDF